MTTPIKLIGFPNTGLLVFHAGIEKGFFENRGSPIELEVTPSSIYQLVSLVDGKFDIACGAVDNFIAYQEGAGEEVPKNDPDLCVFMGATQIELSFVVGKGIESFQQIKGTRLAMDALTTGFAFVLYRMLDNAGLSSDDYEMVSVGATPHRWEGVQSGEYSGTLLIEPFTGQAKAAGYTVLETSRQTFERYPGQMFGVMRGWAEKNRARMVGFVKGYFEALNWVLDDTNTEEAQAMLGRHMPQMDSRALGPALSKLKSPETGLVPEGRIDREGLKTVLELRSHYAPQGRLLTDIEKYIDESYYEEALS
jgi:ABC-type nitrate/sulfonate/bicarbonate transport system substrate-binding protein